ncbi:MAG: autotransporter outer membrane beta-barrel domain-containing protein [Phascolarctobacterium sp.]|uniref:autotransporter outer membrane beta-barrel domain-containing protein n=1 Tax=Phascolarctobacterium sp. TaxID=2049039 RepID=UPI0025CDB25F|nr:autotransporter outer membrane beta-barrel domain-containing protein [Phascolarctobacterium sp.]MCC8159646.1 autotransporter outer membrane beta-barrel domain-containing protein [Phascolarctobacterium sp.]
MKKKDLSSKVLVSLMTMSCVYLGGTSALPTVEAVTILEGGQTGSKHFTDDIVVNFPNPSSHWQCGIYANTNEVVTIAPGKTVTVNIGGVSGDDKANIGIAAWNGNINLDKVIINSIDVGVLAQGNNSSITLGDDCIVHTTGNSGNVVGTGGHGLQVAGVDGEGSTAKISVGDRLKVTVTGTATGNMTLAALQVQGINGDPGAASLQVGNDAEIITKGRDSYGLWIYRGTADIGDNLKITTEGLNGRGILAHENGKINIGSGLNVKTVGVEAIAVKSAYSTSEINIGNNSKIESMGAVGSGFAYALYADAGKINLNGDSTIIASTGKNAGSIYADNAGQVNADGVLNITGCIVAATGGIVDFTMQEGSRFAGLTDMTGAGTINLDMTGSNWDIAGNSQINRLVLKDSVIDMTADGNAYSTLTTGTLSGTGGIFKQDIDVRSMESDQIFVTNDFSGTQALDIYQKDDYIPAAGSTEGIGLVLASVNGDGVFTAKDREGTLFRSHYDLANKASTAVGYDFDWYLKAITVDNETTSVKTIMSANALNYHTWRTENDKLLQRMGELRNNGEAAKGAWFRMQGSKIGRSGNFGFENKYTAYELGYDEVTKRTEDVTRYQGFALSYTGGNSSYSSGSGDNSSKAISFYNTEIGSKGHYLDMVLKISNMDNDFTVYDSNSNKITSDFNNTGVALSAEYGRKNDLQNGWYIEPQAQFTLGYLGGDSYTASNGIEVSQSGIRSAVGRIGFNIGKEVGSKGIVYAKANLMHEFGGGYDVTMRDSSGRVAVSDSFNDTWFEYGIGAALQTGKNNHIYFDVERSSGSDFKKDWQWNAGARWTF